MNFEKLQIQGFEICNIIQTNRADLFPKSIIALVKRNIYESRLYLTLMVSKDCLVKKYWSN